MIANEEAIALIDKKIPQFSTRKLAETSEVIDLLLDLRGHFSPVEADINLPN